MKVVIQNMSRVWGGNEKWLSILARGLLARGHDVIVSCPRGPVRERIEQLGIPTTAVRPRGVLDFVSGLSFAAWLRSENPDSLLMTSWHSVAWSALAARLARKPRVVLRQGIVRQAPARGIRARALRNDVDAMIVNSPEIKREWLRSAPGFDPEKIRIVLNAIDLRIAERDAFRRELRSELSVDDGTLLIGSAGNLFKRKGFDLLLRAFADSKVEAAHLVIAGDGEERKNLESLALELGVHDRVDWLGQRSDAPEVIAGLDIFVLSSSNEGMANVMLEAMAAGTPVIAFDISGVLTAIGESADRPAAGWIVPLSDIGALAGAIARVTELIVNKSDEIPARVAEAAWRIESWFGTERMVDECERILFQ